MPSAAHSRREILAAIPYASAALGLLVSPGAGLADGLIRKSPADWLRQLGPARFRVLREAATEPPFSSPLTNEHRRGTFSCAGCALPLFVSSAKFDSGTGWPSFFAPLAHAVTTRPDRSIGMDRTEVLCSRCSGHLGHVFPDGPKPTGLRYCMNGLALQFRPAGAA